ncbi:MAG: tetratricopeptide repeat protein [Crocinitomicaceae bacterium]
MRRTLFILLSFLPLFIYAQEKTLDQELDRIESISSLKARTKAYDDATEQAWRNGNPNDALVYSERGLKIAKEQSFKSLESQLHNNRGVAYDFLSQYPSALEHYFAGLTIQEKLDKPSPDTKADLLGNIGLIYMNQEVNDKALYYHGEALKIRRSINDHLGISASLNNLAIVYTREGKLKKAIEYYKACIEIDSIAQDVIGLSADFNNLALAYMELEDWDIALIYLDKSLEIRKSNGDILGQSINYSNFGEINYKLGNYNEAKENFLLAIKLAKQVNDRESLRFSYSKLSLNEEKAKRFESALTYYELFIRYKDSITNAENVRLQTEFELNYQFDKEKEVARLKQEEKDRQYTIILIAVSSGLILILFFSVLFFRKWKQTQAQQRTIKEKNKLVEQKNQEIMASISYAKRIQNAILPSSSELQEAFWNHFVLYLPKDEVSGDFYWMDELDSTSFLAVADCTGHGVPGAMMSVVCYNALNRSVHEFGKTSVSGILDKTRELVVNEMSKNNESVKDGMDISLCAFQKETNRIEWAGANNPLWIYRKASNTLEEIKADKQPIGYHQNPRPFEKHEVELQEGDRIYLFSDGYQDQFGGSKSKKMMRKGFKKVILESAELSLKEQRALLNIHFINWKNTLEQVDDVCIVGIEYVT